MKTWMKGAVAGGTMSWLALLFLPRPEIYFRVMGKTGLLEIFGFIFVGVLIGAFVGYRAEKWEKVGELKTWQEGALVGGMIGLIGLFLPYIAWGFSYVVIHPLIWLNLYHGNIWPYKVIFSILIWSIVGIIAGHGIGLWRK